MDTNRRCRSMPICPLSRTCNRRSACPCQEDHEGAQYIMLLPGFTTAGAASTRDDLESGAFVYLCICICICICIWTDSTWHDARAAAVPHRSWTSYLPSSAPSCPGTKSVNVRCRSGIRIETFVCVKQATTISRKTRSLGNRKLSD